MALIMGILNLTPDSFVAASRANADDAPRRIREMAANGADIVDIGAVSTRPGAADVSVEQEWARLEPVLSAIADDCRSGSIRISIDTTSSETVCRCHELLGSFIVNDISAGEDDPRMLSTVGRLGLPYVAMHKRGNPRTMDSMCSYDDGIIPFLKQYFHEFSKNAADAGITEWIMDPGLGFAKTPAQCWEILERLEEIKMPERPLLIGAADKRFTEGRTEDAHRIALLHGADILRVHDVAAAKLTMSRIQDL